MIFLIPNPPTAFGLVITSQPIVWQGLWCLVSPCKKLRFILSILLQIFEGRRVVCIQNIGIVVVVDLIRVALLAIDKYLACHAQYMNLVNYVLIWVCSPPFSKTWGAQVCAYMICCRDINNISEIGAVRRVSIRMGNGI